MLLAGIHKTAWIPASAGMTTKNIGTLFCGSADRYSAVLQFAILRFYGSLFDILRFVIRYSIIMPGSFGARA